MSDAVEVCENILALHVTRERGTFGSNLRQTDGCENMRGGTCSPSVLKIHIKLLVSA